MRLFCVEFADVEGQKTESMVDDLDSQDARSSTELWSEICSGLPDLQAEELEGEEFTDCFQPHSPEGTHGNAANGVPSGAPLGPWAPMADSEVYIASLENRLRKIKGQSQEITSREMLRTLSQAKKECWDRFLHDAPGSDPFLEGSDIDPSALEHLKRWLQPEKVAISAEELEYLLLPEQNWQRPAAEASCSVTEDRAPEEEEEEDESQAPEK